MPSPELAAQLADLGGFALFLFVVTAGAIGLFRGWIVPGWIYRQEQEARKAAETQALRNAEALEKLRRDVARDARNRRPDGPQHG